MSNSDSIRETIERLSQQEKKLLGELSELRVTIRTLKRTAGIEVGEESQSDSPDVTVSDAASGPVQGGNGGRPTIRPDEFFGATHAEAARRYLKIVGHAVSFAELVDVLRRGGCKLTSSDPERVLWISLIKNSRDFVPPQQGFVGLKEFYPARVRAKQVNERQATRAKRSARRNGGKSNHLLKQRPNPRPTRENSPKKTGSSEPGSDTNAQKRIPLAVHEFMSDKQFHRVDEIVDAVRRKLGDPIPRVSVHGALSSKKSFEKNDEGLYRLLG